MQKTNNFLNNQNYVTSNKEIIALVSNKWELDQWIYINKYINGKNIMILLNLLLFLFIIISWKKELYLYIIMYFLFTLLIFSILINNLTSYNNFYVISFDKTKYKKILDKKINKPHKWTIYDLPIFLLVWIYFYILLYWKTELYLEFPKFSLLITIVLFFLCKKDWFKKVFAMFILLLISYLFLLLFWNNQLYVYFPIHSLIIVWVLSWIDEKSFDNKKIKFINTRWLFIYKNKVIKDL